VWIPGKKHEVNTIVLLGQEEFKSLTKTTKSFFSGITLQKIYYGTPGSGKSHKVKELVEVAYPDENERDKYVIRTTFHPDSDYASFVGCYKPKMNDGAITYEFVPQVFTKAYVRAWNEPEKQVYLIVEEINRGNCAQIFGDLFQLLDRKGGVSEYPIDADDDLRQHLEKELNEAGKAGIANGKIKLPKNLNILATMNTSDQSLFPMDSAFKRRWTWECVPIDYNNPDSGAFIISLGEKKYNWHEFLKMVNELIRKATDSEDKQMGNFFIDGDVDESQFVNKVMFYLWNDVCKEEFGTKNNFFRYYTDSNGTEKEFSFNDLFGTDAHNILVKFMVHTGFKDDGEQPNNEEPETEVE
jgi:5-methylcytosine-specific restriction endonuclease McrBC GTP-binding regulatory subunit McrB